MDYLNAPGYVEAWNAVEVKCSGGRRSLSGGRPSNLSPALAARFAKAEQSSSRGRRPTILWAGVRGVGTSVRDLRRLRLRPAPHRWWPWPREESNLRTRIRSLMAPVPICREEPADTQAARQGARHSCGARRSHPTNSRSRLVPSCRLSTSTAFDPLVGRTGLRRFSRPPRNLRFAGSFGPVRQWGSPLS